MTAPLDGQCDEGQLRIEGMAVSPMGVSGWR